MTGYYWPYRLTCMLTWSIWFGGLTFYAATVVPLGAEQIGETAQGMITQQVTLRLNAIGAISLLIWIPATFWRAKLKVAGSLWLLQVLVLLVLAVMHRRLTDSLDLEYGGPATPDFYDMHRIYLIATTIQWLGLLGIQIDWQTRSQIADVV